MECKACGSANERDAGFCEQCGEVLVASTAALTGRKNRIYLALLVAVVAAGLAAAGYYRFVLPRGIAAVVNGEEILLSEVDAQLQGFGSGAIPEEFRGRARYRILNDLITERIAWHEAKKAGTQVTEAEIDAVHEGLAAGSGGKETFDAAMRTHYGSMRAYRRSLERGLVIRKYIDETVTAGIADPAAASRKVGAWLREISDRASVRVALAEQLPGPGAGCGGACCDTGKGGAASPSAVNSSASVREARAAALAYWRDKYGDDQVETRVRDLGCHVEVDMLKGKTVARSLRYQSGTITER